MDQIGKPTPFFSKRPFGPTFPFLKSTSPADWNPWFEIQISGLLRCGLKPDGTPVTPRTILHVFQHSTGVALPEMVDRRSHYKDVPMLFLFCFCEFLFHHGLGAAGVVNHRTLLIVVTCYRRRHISQIDRVTKLRGPKPRCHKLEKRPAAGIVQRLSMLLPGSIRMPQQREPATSMKIAPLRAPWAKKAAKSLGSNASCSDRTQPCRSHV
jgi:hypothetical protein